MGNAANAPAYRRNIYARSAIVDPYPHYARLRQLGTVVWLPRQRVYALPRYSECKAALRDDGRFASGQGVALNPLTNRLSRGTTLNSDGADHDRRRKLLAHRLTPKALRSMSEAIDRQAAAVVEAAVARRHVDGVRDVATALPLAVVPDLVGWPENGRENLIDWAGATFDSLGPLNRQWLRTTPAALSMLRFSRRVVRDRAALPGSMGDDVLNAADAGEVPRAECPALMIDYLAPSLDTTISAISSALHLFATHPDQWQALREDPSLVANAVNEVVRLESPLRAFSRKAVTDVELGGSLIPRDSRILVIYASANRDEREWDDPDSFDITRDVNRHLGFGYGTHGCAGQGLARLESQAILRELAARVERINLTGEPIWAVNNIIHRYQRLPLELVPA
ncbi:cytochrome P450 [Mycolicibacterium frederiksbergense]|uniref:Cytochrome P450 n=1 Tax=Mycolicibacterium frederiksbergense TaxID=117567 RepID=A0A6H0S1K8_9MYCO|nr:cytochrome P450 [Mycolicibacterium frederiksbergense]QIV80581.1 cytochrome P450 [Mycolicibacterium frederiksbergense]